MTARLWSEEEEVAPLRARITRLETALANKQAALEEQSKAADRWHREYEDAERRVKLVCPECKGRATQGGETE